MQAKVRTVAFQGINVLPIDVQVMIAPGTIAFAMVGLADKAVGESRERIRAALRALGLALGQSLLPTKPLKELANSARQMFSFYSLSTAAYAVHLKQ